MHILLHFQSNKIQIFQSWVQPQKSQLTRTSSIIYYLVVMNPQLNLFLYKLLIKLMEFLVTEYNATCCVGRRQHLTTWVSGWQRACAWLGSLADATWPIASQWHVGTTVTWYWQVWNYWKVLWLFWVYVTFEN